MGKKARLFPSGELKLHCRSLLFSLIQLSTYYASKNPDGFDGLDRSVEKFNILILNL